MVNVALSVTLKTAAGVILSGAKNLNDIRPQSVKGEDFSDRTEKHTHKSFCFLAGVGLAVAFFIFGTSQPLNAQSLKKIRIASKSAGESLVPYLIPQRLGFYREEGLDVDVIVTRGTVTTQVVVSGAADYGNGGSIPAIFGGARLKILQVSTDKPSQYLVASPKITHVKQLSGKTVAISDASGNSTLLFRELLSKNGVRSEEHTSELQSHHDLVCRLLLEKKKKDK